jgi:hypothetical protein
MPRRKVRRLGRVEQAVADAIAEHQTQVKIAHVGDDNAAWYEITTRQLCEAAFGTRDPTRAQQVSVRRVLRKLVKAPRVKVLPPPEFKSVYGMKALSEIAYQLKPGDWYSRLGRGRLVYYSWIPKITAKEAVQLRNERKRSKAV